MPAGVDRLALGGILKDITPQEYANDFANTTNLKSSGLDAFPSQPAIAASRCLSVG
jgi:hypothetical protein